MTRPRRTRRVLRKITGWLLCAYGVWLALASAARGDHVRSLCGALHVAAGALLLMLEDDT